MFPRPVLYISNTFLSILADPSSADFWIKVTDVFTLIFFKLPFNRNGTVPKAPNTIIIIIISFFHTTFVRRKNIFLLQNAGAYKKTQTGGMRALARRCLNDITRNTSQNIKLQQ